MHGAKQQFTVRSRLGSHLAPNLITFFGCEEICAECSLTMRRYKSSNIIHALHYKSNDIFLQTAYIKAFYEYNINYGEQSNHICLCVNACYLG